MTNEFNQTDPTRLPPEGSAHDDQVDPVLDPAARPGYDAEAGIVDDSRSDLTDGSAGYQPAGSVTGSELLDDPYGRPGVPGDRGEDPGVVIDPADQFDQGVVTGDQVPPMEPGSGDGFGSRSVGNPGDTPHLVDEMDPPRSVGNPGETPDPVAEYDAPRSVGNPGETPDPLAEYDPPRSIGNPGSND